jgi:hypothetical protein
MFPWEMLETRVLPRPQHIQLGVGDLLCFHSEGLEDSRRDWHGAKMLDERGHEAPAEFFSVERIRGLIASVMKRGSWTLARSRTAGEPGDLSFDFSGCTGTAEDAVIALAAAEKVFRLVPLRSGSETTMVEVDPPVDRFLQRHFRHYGEFFGVPVADAEGSRRFAELREDPLLDDILILAVRRIEPQAPEPKRVIRLQDEEPTEVLPLIDEDGLEEIPADEVEHLEDLPAADDDDGELLPV